jgi:hypothetical protein
VARARNAQPDTEKSAIQAAYLFTTKTPEQPHSKYALLAKVLCPTLLGSSLLHANANGSFCLSSQSRLIFVSASNNGSSGSRIIEGEDVRMLGNNLVLMRSIPASQCARRATDKIHQDNRTMTGPHNRDSKVHCKPVACGEATGCISISRGAGGILFNKRQEIAASVIPQRDGDEGQCGSTPQGREINNSRAATKPQTDSRKATMSHLGLCRRLNGV